MAEEKNEEAEKAGGPSWVILGVAVLVALVAGGAGAYFLLPSAPSEAAEAEAMPEASPEEKAAAYRERVLTLEPFVVNIAGDDYPRYLKVKIDLELDEATARAEVDARLAQVRDAVIVLLSSKRLTDVTDFDGKVLLKEDLRERINGLLDDGQVTSVFFTEFVVQ